MPVAYQGKTYYVCCSGCRDAFRDDPEKYIKEFEAQEEGESEGSLRFRKLAANLPLHQGS